MRVAITGASGFIGRHLVRSLAQAGHEVRGLARGAEAARRVEGARGRAVPGDVTQPATLAPLVEDADAVVHLAAVVRARSEGSFDQVIREGTGHVLAAARDAGVGRFVHLSAAGVTEDPAQPYLHAKWRAEQAVRGSGLAWTILRPTLVYGEGDHVVTLLAEMAASQPVVPVLGSGDFQVQPLWVGDLVQVVQRCLEDPALEGRVLELGGPERWRYEDLLDAVMGASGHLRPKLAIPAGMMGYLTRGMEWTMESPPMTYGELKTLLRGEHLADTGVLRQEFGIAPTPLAEGLRFLRRDHAPPDAELGPPAGAGAPPGTPHMREPGRPGMQGEE